MAGPNDATERKKEKKKEQLLKYDQSLRSEVLERSEEEPVALCARSGNLHVIHPAYVLISGELERLNDSREREKEKNCPVAAEI